MAMRRESHTKSQNVMVLEEGRVLGEDRALVGLFDVGFERHQAVFAGLVEQVVHHFQSVDIGLLAELGAAEDAANAAGDFLDDVQGLATRSVPRAAPPMMINSAGWTEL